METNERIGTDSENELAQRYDDFVKEKLLGKIDDYLKTIYKEKSIIAERINEIQTLYIEMFDIQYELSKISPKKTILVYLENQDIKKKKYAYAIDDQAKNWLNRLSSTLNILTIKASEFSERKAKRRDYLLFSLSIIISTAIGTWSSKCSNDKNKIDMNNRTTEIKKYQDSILNKMRQEYILSFDTLKHNKNNSHKHKIIENQNKLTDKNTGQKYSR